jgi:hypothetical protein
MALADDIRSLGTQSTEALNESHDYYTYMGRSWLLLQRIVREGRRFKFHNPATGSRVNERSLMDRRREYLGVYLRSATFQHFVTLFKDFVFDLLRLWLAAHPQSLSRKQVEVSVVLNALDKTAILLAVADKELNELKYGRVADWFAYLHRLVRIDCPSVDEIEQLAEIKASRDILVHNKGIVNATYLSKAGGRARFQDREELEIPENYHRSSWELIRKVVQDVSQAALQRA